MSLAALRLAVGTLTILPTGPIPNIDRPTAGRAMLLAPLGVLPIAVVTVTIGWLAAVLDLPWLIGGLLMVGALAFGTRAMHLDGLADTIDGLGSGWDRERSLTIMRRGDVGPMGAITLIIIIGLQASALGLVVRTLPGALIAAVIISLSRGALALVCRAGVPSARPDGLGVAVAGSVSRSAAALTWLGIAVVVAALALLRPGSVIGPLIAVLLAAVVVIGLVRHCVRRLGGVTGDVMGAAIELAFTVMIIGFAA